MRVTGLFSTALLSAALAACASVPTPSDAAPDGPASDAPAAGDSAPPDAPSTDASAPEASAPDAPPADSGPLAPSYATLSALTASCNRLPGSPLYATDDGASSTIPVCALQGAVFWRSDMDIDCDGVTTTQCNARTDPSYQSQTSLETSMRTALDAAHTPYVVVPLPRTGFDYNAAGLRLGAAAAVLYNGRLVYAVFGDEGPSNIIGEGSYALAQALGIDPDPATGGVDSGVTFIVFTGASAVLSRPEDPAHAASVGAARAQQLLAQN